MGLIFQNFSKVGGLPPPGPPASYAYGDKCHLMVFGDKSNDVTLNIGSITIKESTEEKLLGVILDKNLCFKQHVKSICKKTGQKLVIKWAAV